MVSIYIYGKFNDFNVALSVTSSVWTNYDNVKVEDRLTKGTLIIPVDEVAIRELFILKNKGYRGLIPNEYYLETFSDKIKFSEYIKEINLINLCPLTYNLKDVKFPCVFKPNNLLAGCGIKVIRDNVSLKTEIKNNNLINQKFLLQSLILGKEEYVSHCICLNGELLWHCTYEYISNTRETIRNHCTSAKKIILPDHILSELILFIKPYDSNKIGYTGVCSFNYKIINSHIKLFEINPRFGGSIMKLENRDDLREAISCIIGNAIEI